MPEPPNPRFRHQNAIPRPSPLPVAGHKNPVLWAFFVGFMGPVNRLTAFRSAYLAPQELPTSEAVSGGRLLCGRTALSSKPTPNTSSGPILDLAGPHEPRPNPDLRALRVKITVKQRQMTSAAGLRRPSSRYWIASVTIT